MKAPGSYAPKIKFVQENVNYLAGIWFQFVPCEMTGATWQMLPQLNRPSGELEGAPFSVISGSGTCAPPTTATTEPRMECDILTRNPTAWISSAS